MLEHFELIDFIFIVWVPSRTSIHQVMVQLEIYRLDPLRRLNKFQCRKPNILLTFMQTLFTWLFHFISWVVVRPSYLVSYNESSGWPWRVLLKLIGFLFRVRQDFTFVWMESHFLLSFPYCKIVQILLCIDCEFYSHICNGVICKWLYGEV